MPPNVSSFWLRCSTSATRTAHDFLAAALLLPCLACESEPPEAPAASEPAAQEQQADAPWTSRDIPIGGRSMHIECWGRGGPTVVFDSGHGAQPSGWYGVTTVVAEQVRACVYSRLGIGRSAPPPRPHTPMDMALELGELLTASGEAPPFVLVGHSLGGINIRLYAREHREEVAGFVFVDPSHEDQYRDLEAVLPGALQQMGGATEHRSAEGMTFEAFVAGLEAVREGNRSLGDVPVVVLSAALQETAAFLSSAPEGASERLVRAKHERYTRLAALSPNSVQAMAWRSGHMIPFEQPGLVARAVLEVVRAVREKDRVQAARIEEP